MSRKTSSQYNALFAYAHEALKDLQNSRDRLIQSIRSGLGADRSDKHDAYGTVLRARGHINVTATTLIERIEGSIFPGDEPAVDYVGRLGLDDEVRLYAFVDLIKHGAKHLRFLSGDWARQAETIIFDDYITKSRNLTNQADYQYIDDVVYALEDGQLPSHSVYQLIESTKPIYESMTATTTAAAA